MSTDIKKFPIMPAKCSTCPFRTDANGRHLDPKLTSKIMHQVLTEASQICHHPRLSGKKENHLCRGARDYQLEIFYRLGVISEPTDTAWQERLNKMSDTHSEY